MGWDKNMEYDDDLYGANDNAVELAEGIQKLCSELLNFECNESEIGKIFPRLDGLLARHAHICSQLWPKLYANARECSELDF